MSSIALIVETGNLEIFASEELGHVLRYKVLEPHSCHVAAAWWALPQGRKDQAGEDAVYLTTLIGQFVAGRPRRRQRHNSNAREA